MGKRLGCVLGVAGLAASAWAWGAPPAEGATIAFKCALATINDVHHEFCKRYVARLEQRSNGQIKGQIFPAGQLGPIPRLIEGVQLGTIEAFAIPPDFFVGVDPRFQALSAPYLFNDLDHAYRTLNDKEFLGRYLALAEGKGIKGVGLYPVAPAGLVSRTPIRTPDDVRGKKVRVLATPMERAMIASLGATGVPIAWGETLPALQQGAVDAVQAGITVLSAFKYYDVAKWFTSTDHYLIQGIATVSKKWYDSLPADLQRAVVEEGPAIHQELQGWLKSFYHDSARVWKERTRDGWVELTADQRAAFRQRIEGTDEKVAKEVPAVKDLLDLVRAKARQYAK